MSNIQNIYEKMLQNPKNRVRSQMKQPTPFDGHDKEIPASQNEEVVNDADDAFFRAVDQRMANKKSGGTHTDQPIMEQASIKKMAKLEARVEELEELVTIMMKQQMKLMKG